MSCTGDIGRNIVVVGSCMIDFVGYSPKLPKVGETIHGSKFVTNFGGKGANQCVAAAKLGARTALVARVGDDQWGDKYIDNLKQQNVDTQLVLKTENECTGIAQINVADNGDNQIVIIAGANKNLGVKDVAKAADTIQQADVLVLQLETSTEVAIEAMKLCKGISILNGAPAIDTFDTELLKLPSIFCVNESEASVFTNISVGNKSEAKVACEKFLSMGCQSVIITLGADGAVYANKNAFIEVSSPQVICKDSTGAGDAFIGALAYMLSQRKDSSIEENIALACKIASDSVTRLGTQISFCGPEILNKLEC